MDMQHDDKKLLDAVPVVISPVAEFKCAKARAETRMRIREIDSASRLLVEDCPELAAWFIMQVRTGRESSVESAMVLLQIEALVLREPEQIVVRRGRQWTCPGRPWMPGFVLVRCVPSASAFRGLLGVKHVDAVVGGWQRPYRVKPEIIMDFNSVMQEQEDERERKRIEQETRNAAIGKGARVRIKLGPFAGMEATVLRVGKGTGRRCELSYRLYGHEGKATIPLANLEAL